MKISKLLLLAALSFTMVGCNKSSTNTPSNPGGNNPGEVEPHTHHFSSEWSHDETHHWHACEGCDQKQDYEEHTFVEKGREAPTYDDPEIIHMECNVCGYTKDIQGEPRLEHHYAEEWSHDENSHWHNCTDEGYEHLKGDESAHEYGEWNIITPATVLEEGLKEHTCEVCGYVHQEVIPMVIASVSKIGDQLLLIAEDGTPQTNITYQGNYFDENGVLTADHEFVYVEDKVYYLIDSTVQYGFLIIGGQLYYFKNTGVRAEEEIIDYHDLTGDGVNDSIYFDEEGQGAPVGCDKLVIYIDVTPVLLTLNGIVSKSHLSIRVYESDTDDNEDNNRWLSNVSYELINDYTSLSGTTDSNGYIDIPETFFGDTSITLALSNYFTRIINIDITSEQEEHIFAIDRNVSNTLTGKFTVADTDMNFSNNVPIGDATVTLERIGNYVDPITPKVTTTDSNGNYSFNGLTAGMYKLIFEKEGYKTVNDIATLKYNETSAQNVTIEAIDITNPADGIASGKITNATTGYAVPGMTIRFRDGVNMTSGEVLEEVVTDDSGAYTVSLPAGNYTGEIIDLREESRALARFLTTYLVIKIIAEATIANQNATISPAFDGIRIVLEWGSSPSDLDSHLLYRQTGGSNIHCYYSTKTTTYATLDVDDTSSYGPETISVTSSFTGVMRYYVHDFSNKNNSSSTALSNSGAKVSVYLGGSAAPDYVIHVPSGRGYYWNVFSYDVANMNFAIVNTIGTSTPSV